MEQQAGTNLEFTWHDEFWSFDSHQHVDSAEDEDGQDDGEVTDELPHLGDGEQIHLAVNRCLIMLATLNLTLVLIAHSGGEEGAGLELLQPHGAGVGAKEQDEGHEGDVWDKVAGFAHQLAFVL